MVDPLTENMSIIHYPNRITGGAINASCRTVGPVSHESHSYVKFGIQGIIEDALFFAAFVRIRCLLKNSRMPAMENRA